MVEQNVVHSFEQVAENSGGFFSLSEQLGIRKRLDQTEDAFGAVLRERLHVRSCVRNDGDERLVERPQDSRSDLDHPLDHLVREIGVRAAFEVFEIELQLQSVGIVQNHREVSVAGETQQDEDSDVKKVALCGVFLHHIEVVEDWSIDFWKKFRMRNNFFNKVHITLNKSPKQNK